MTTLTVTKARANLSTLLQRAGKGEDIGIVSGDKIIALRPVEEISAIPMTEEYVLREYNVSAGEWKNFKKQTQEKTADLRKKRKIVRFAGRFDPDTL